MSTRKFLTHHEVSLLLQAALASSHPERDTCMILLAFLHGLRVSELLSLRLADLELVSRKLCVRVSKRFQYRSSFTGRRGEVPQKLAYRQGND